MAPYDVRFPRRRAIQRKTTPNSGIPSAAAAAPTSQPPRLRSRSGSRWIGALVAAFSETDASIDVVTLAGAKLPAPPSAAPQPPPRLPLGSELDPALPIKNILHYTEAALLPTMTVKEAVTAFDKA